ncbi:hypothetical protein ABZ736_28040 [Streptomyces sp. NPDC013099]|uniref:hypothetical protein n=1 Tax=Streptomyces sp. NPDC013099 TaxID=3156687 RepID=UPI0033C04A47
MKKIMTVMLPALALSLAVPNVAHAIGDTGTGGSGNATLLGPLVAPTEVNGKAVSALMFGIADGTVPE